MSREIKFRAYKNTDKKYSYWHDLLNQNLKNILISPNSCGYESLEQYTGLKDTNGVEIYEGDIVTLDRNYGDIETGICKISSEFGVLFEYFDSKLQHCDFGWCGSKINYLDRWEYTIIGNIHENPELLALKNGSDER